jgi:hypothetical protein
MVSAEWVAALYGRPERRQSIRSRICGKRSLAPFSKDVKRDMGRKQVRPL